VRDLLTTDKLIATKLFLEWLELERTYDEAHAERSENPAKQAEIVKNQVEVSAILIPAPRCNLLRKQAVKREAEVRTTLLPTVEPVNLDLTDETVEFTAKEDAACAPMLTEIVADRVCGATDTQTRTRFKSSFLNHNAR
jgi:hypothetical protein